MGVLFLSAEDFDSLGIPIKDAIKALEDALRLKSIGQAEAPSPAPPLKPRDNCQLELSHARIGGATASESCGSRWRSSYPPTASRGNLPATAGLVTLADVATGIPLAVMDSASTGAMRIGAEVGAAAKVLARSESTRVAIVGKLPDSAVRHIVAALAATLPALKHVSAEGVIEELQGQWKSLEFTSSKTVPSGADVIVVGPGGAVSTDHLSFGATVIAIDTDKAVSSSLQGACNKVFSDDGGPTDLGKVLSAKSPGRESPKDRVAVTFVGGAIGDVAVAKVAYDRARILGLGSTWNMYPKL